ncbi:MAG: MATE family efflux transporter [Clostridia bacterium]|nr:MATE family efflux transporter [Clostridia bacterium]
MDKANKTDLMLNAPVEKLIIKLAIPTIITMVITNVYNLVDTAFIGTISTAASGAVGIVFGFMAIIQATGFLFGQGSGSIVSRSLGQGNVDDATTTASSGFYSSFLAGLLITVLGFIFMDPIVYFFGSTDTIAPYAKTYLTYILIAAPGMTGCFALNNLLRFEGMALNGMVGMLSGAILNIGGDALFIFKFNMGIAGAGLSTCISQYISFAILMYPFITGKTQVKISPFKMDKNFRQYTHIMNTGLPSLIRQGLSSIATIILNNLAAGYGDAAVAAMSIATRISFLAFSLALGIGQGFQPVCGFNYGAKKYDRLRHAFKFTIGLAEVVMSVFLVFMFIFSEDLVALFRDDPEVIIIGTRALRAQCIGMILLPVVSVGEMMFQSSGNTRFATTLSLLRNGLLFIPALFILSSLRGLYGIEEAQPVAYILSYPIGIGMIIYFLIHLPNESKSN